MEIRNRLFPYPVLCNETDDYQNDVFEAETKVEERIHDIHVTVKFKLNNIAILDMIRKGMAEYALHVECPTTYYRKMFKTDISELSFAIPKEKVNGDIAVLAVVVAKRRIASFISESLNEDYDGETISFDKAAIMAYKNLPKIQVFKNYEELAGNESLFTVVKIGLPDDEEIHPLAFELNDERIKIMVDARTYASYIHYQQKTSVAMSMLVFPAVVYMLDELRDSPDSFGDRMWYVKMKQFYRAQGVDFIHDIVLGKNIIEAAQEMLKSPIGKAYCELTEDGV